MSDISLKSIIKETSIIEEEFPGYKGFIVTVAYPGRNALSDARKSATVEKINRRTQQVQQEFDEDKFLEKFVSLAIKGWKGLKVSYLQEIALVDAEGLDPEDEIPYSNDNAYVLVKNSPAFDNWITEMSTDLENFTKSS